MCLIASSLQTAADLTGDSCLVVFAIEHINPLLGAIVSSADIEHNDTQVADNPGERDGVVQGLAA